MALTYAPSRARAATLGLLALDTRLARILAKSQEPMLVQMRFAWWRDELRRAPGERPSGDLLLDLIGVAWRGEEDALVELVDGWEELLADPPIPLAGVERFAGGRGGAFAGLARLLGVPKSADEARKAAIYWGLVDLAARLSHDDERAMVSQMIARHEDSPYRRLPRPLRPLAVLSGLAHRSIRTGESELLGSRGSALAALRLGLFGR